jgi:hypothetical protein
LELRRSLSDLLVKARQRSFQHLLLQQGTRAAVVALGFGIVILLAGTEYVSALWLVPVVAAAVGAGFYIALRKRPSAYGIAQRIDAKLKLADTLSTATHFLETPAAADPALRESQRMQAERLAESVDLKQALPLTRPRALYPAVALALGLAAVLMVRYAVLGSLNPRASLVASAYDNVFGPPKQETHQDSSREGGDQPGDGREEDKDAARNNDFAGDPSANFDPAQPENPKDQSKQQAEKKEQGNNPDMKGNASAKDSPPDDQKEGSKEQAGGKQSDKADQEPSLMSKVRDALNQMMSKMKSSPKDSDKDQKKDPTESEQQQGEDSQSKQKGESKQAQDGKQSNDTQESNNSAPMKASQDTQSGAGSQEGDKTAKQAEAQKAMGKITELLGKRAENVKGAVMVEVGSTKQQLKTPLGQSQSTHAEDGSEIHRDEVPPIYEQFVQEYFEKIRKPSDTAAAPAPKSGMQQ